MVNKQGKRIFLFGLLSLFTASYGQQELDGTCGVVGGGGSQRFDCTFNNNVVSVTCSFDGGEVEDCSLPLGVTIDRFGTDDHFVVLTVTDEFGQHFRTPFLFSLQASPPSAVTNLAVGEVTSSSIEISWSPPDNNGGSPVTYYLIEVAGRNIEVGPDARSYVLTGLIPETNYGFGVSAANIAGGGPALGILGTTPQMFGGACGTVGGGSSQRFDCTFNNNMVSVTCSFDGGEEEDCSLPLVVTADIFGGDDHFVILTAIDEFGQRFRIPLFFRLEASPQSSVRGLAVVGVTSSSIEVSWSPPLSDGGSSVTSYRIQLVESRSLVTEVDLGPDTRRYVLTGLRPQTTYAVFVSAENSAGRGFSVAILATTTALS